MWKDNFLYKWNWKVALWSTKFKDERRVLTQLNWATNILTRSENSSWVVFNVLVWDVFRNACPISVGILNTPCQTHRQMHLSFHKVQISNNEPVSAVSFVCYNVSNVLLTLHNWHWQTQSLSCLFCLFWFLVFRNKVSLFSAGSPGTYSEDHIGLELTKIYLPRPPVCECWD